MLFGQNVAFHMIFLDKALTFYALKTLLDKDCRNMTYRCPQMKVDAFSIDLFLHVIMIENWHLSWMGG